MESAPIVRRELAAQRNGGGVGGHLALQFANTAGWHLAAEPTEHLSSWAEFVRWGQEADVISSSQAKAIRAETQNLDEIIQLREDIFRLALGAARELKPDDAALKRVSEAAEESGPRAVASGGILSWRFEAPVAGKQLASLLARSALALFCSSEAAKIRVCEGGTCGWVFLDDSRSGRRRWCSMNDCGSRAKARRHYQRAKAKAGSSSATA